MLMRVETGEGVHGNSIILAVCLYICKTVKKINSLSLKNFLETKQGSYFFLFILSPCQKRVQRISNKEGEGQSTQQVSKAERTAGG